MVIKCSLLSLLFLVEGVDLLGKGFKGSLSLLLLVLDLGVRGARHQVILVLIELLFSALADGSTENVSVLLLSEVLVIVSVGVCELSWIITIVLPS